MYCWGSDADGQIGNDDVASSNAYTATRVAIITSELALTQPVVDQVADLLQLYTFIPPITGGVDEWEITNQPAWLRFNVALGLLYGVPEAIEDHPNISITAYSQQSGTTMTAVYGPCLLYTSPSPRDRTRSRMPSSA